MSSNTALEAIKKRCRACDTEVKWVLDADFAKLVSSDGNGPAVTSDQHTFSQKSAFSKQFAMYQPFF